ncbi:MAG: hypothetical protein AAB341_04795 [Planctomycetota bacterium]
MAIAGFVFGVILVPAAQAQVLVGACCRSDGVCNVTDQMNCERAGNEFVSVGTNCDDRDICRGACCAENGSCSLLSRAGCGSNEFIGLGTKCGELDCVGACCDPDTGCSDLGTIRCAQGGGEFRGHGTRCALTECFGACCLPEKSCLETTAGACAQFSGAYQGDGTACLEDCPSRLSTGFSYQGQLKENGLPANGVYDLRFALYNVATGGAAISTTVCSEDVPVTNGLFSIVVPLTLPPSGSASYLEAQVRPGVGATCASTTGFSVLDPRQKITPAPIATFASAVTSNPPAVRGAIRLNTVNGQFEGFNGAFWIPFTTGDPIPPGNTQDFTVPGTYEFIVPEGLFALGVDLGSAGGGGGGSSSTAAATSCDSIVGGGGSGAGGGGGFIRAVMDVVPGETLDITVGAGGAPGAISTNGGDGGHSAVVRNSNGLAVVQAFGGQGGARGPQLMNVPIVEVVFDGDCFMDRPLAGGGGNGGEPQTPLALILDMQTGSTGGSGTGPSCAVSYYPTILTFCFAGYGTNNQFATSPPPLPTISAGRGGRGTAPPGTPNNFPPEAGSPGRVRLFWN